VKLAATAVAITTSGVHASKRRFTA